jgi:hypothetical protein
MWHAYLVNITDTEIQIKYTNGTRSFIETIGIEQVQSIVTEKTMAVVDSLDSVKADDFLAVIQARIDELNTKDTNRETFVAKLSQYLGKQII